MSVLTKLKIYTLNFLSSAAFQSVFKTFLFVVASALLTLLMDTLKLVNVPAEWVWVPGVVNVVLVALKKVLDARK